MPNIDFSSIPSPCFLLDEHRLRANLKKIKTVKTATGCQIILALKAFSMFPVFPIISEYLDGATASSLNEARLCFEEMGDLAHVYAPAYLPDELEKLLPFTQHLTFNSVNQYARFFKEVQHFDGHHISCGIRINPEYSEVETDLYNPCVAGTRLGMTIEQLNFKLPEGIEGLHFHSLCENNSFTLEKTLASVEAKFGELLHQVKWLNMGGGHLITHKDYDVEHLISLINRIQETYNLRVILEPGSAIAWETGWLVSTVLDTFDSQGVQAVILDCSVSAHMPDCIEMPYKPRILGATDAISGKKAYRMGGMTCLAGDYVGDYSFEKELKIGDMVVFDDMIHYTMVKTTTFNGVNLPNIGLLDMAENFQLLRSFGYESFKDRLG